MADTLPQTLSKQLSGLSRLPAHRQFGLVLGLAVVAAIAIGVALWGFSPRYTILLSGASSEDATAAVEALDRREIPHRLAERSGALMVPVSRVHEARLALATEGLPRAHGVGFELLEQQHGFVASEALESARYQRALEGEIARSIETLDSIDSARVHLALPRQSVFLRDRVKPSASVLVNLHAGRTLDDAQIAGIVNLVASSVTGLETARVTVVDQRGRLLSRGDETGAGVSPSRQLDITRRIEDAYQRRVEDILAPLVGRDGMRVQVTAEVDFTEVESTLETYDPSKSALRSEQISEESSPSGFVGGVPGSLTNQPPGGATVASVGAIAGSAAGLGSASALDAAAGGRAETGANGARAGLAASGDTAEGQGPSSSAGTAGPMSRSRRATRNFELDRKIDHVRQAPATLKRLSVAVVVDDKNTVDAEGAQVRTPRGTEEMEHLTALVREAVGFDEARGDRVNVINASFRELESAEPLPEEPLWQQPWVHDLARYGVAALGFMLLVLLVLRPVLKSLAHVPGPAEAAEGISAPTAGAAGLAAPLAPGLPTPPAAIGNDSVALTEQALGRARRVAMDDPRVAAQVVRQWIHGDGK